MNDDLALKPGDVVSYEGEDYVVVSQTTYRAARVNWCEWMLRLGSGDEWLILVSADQQLLMGEACALKGAPGDEALAAGGRPFRLSLAGKADVETVNEAGATGFDRVQFWHYSDEAQGRLFATRSHGGDRALLLQPTDPIAFEVYGA